MKTRVEVAPQVESFVKSLAPEPRRRLTRVLKSLARNQGDVQHLEGSLAGYSRLRIAGHRVIFHERSEGGERIIDCVFAEQRSLVYELFHPFVERMPRALTFWALPRDFFSARQKRFSTGTKLSKLEPT